MMTKELLLTENNDLNKSRDLIEIPLNHLRLAV